MRFFIPLLLLLPLYAFAALSINEIMYDLPLPGSDTGREWVEIYNNGSNSIDLTKWKFDDEATSKHSLNAPPKNGGQGSVVIEPNTYIILASDATVFLSEHPNFSATVIDTVMSLGQQDDRPYTLRLIGEDGSVEEVIYQTSLGAKGDGNSLQKINGIWSAAIPTPGNVNVFSQGAPDSPTQTAPQPEQQVPPQAPSFTLSASITSGTQATVGKPINFTGEAKKDGVAVSFAQFVWTFGDGQGNEGKDVSHIYASEGTYTVVLHVFYEERNASDSISVTVSEEQLKETPPVQSVPQTASSSQLSQGEKVNQKTQPRQKENTTKQTYILPKKSANMTPESITPETGQTAALALKERPLMPWLIGLGVVTIIPIAFVFLAKPKKNEADEIKILE